MNELGHIKQRLKCLFGFHDWGVLYVMTTGATLSVTRSNEGHQVEIDNSPDPNPRVVEYCKCEGCRGHRRRPDIDPTTVESGCV